MNSGVGIKRIVAANATRMNTNHYKLADGKLVGGGLSLSLE
jgi:hypothetical protein